MRARWWQLLWSGSKQGGALSFGFGSACATNNRKNMAESSGLITGSAHLLSKATFCDILHPRQNLERGICPTVSYAPVYVSIEPVCDGRAHWNCNRTNHGTDLFRRELLFFGFVVHLVIQDCEESACWVALTALMPLSSTIDSNENCKRQDKNKRAVVHLDDGLVSVVYNVKRVEFEVFFHILEWLSNQALGIINGVFRVVFNLWVGDV